MKEPFLLVYMNISHENTANKLRPKTFKELAGQEFIVSTICSSIEKNNIAPAYLFSGPRGVGKTSTARLVALAINRPPDSSVDNLYYQGSEDIRLGKSLDVIEIDGASYTSVENIRNIREEILYAPVHLKYKVYIIDEVHMLSNSAFNALLKTIEEPPPYIVFIFATTELHKLPTTIRSRCQQFSFRLISLSKISEQLEQICAKDNIEADSTALQWIAKEAQGSFRDAYTLFDQIKSFCNDKKITIQHIKTHLGLAGLDTLNEIFSSCIQGNKKLVLEQIENILVQGVSIEQFIIEVAEYTRNLLLLKAGVFSTTVIGYSAELFNKQIYESLSVEQIERALALVLACHRNLRYSINSRFEIELVFAQLCEISLYLTPQQLVSQLKQLKHTQNQEIPLEQTTDNHSLKNPSLTDILPQYTTTNNNNASPTPSQKEKKEHTPTSPEQENNALFSQNSSALWKKIVSKIQEANNSLSLILDSAQSTQHDNSVDLFFNNEFSFNKFKSYEEKILKLAINLTGQTINIQASLSNQTQKAPSSTTTIINQTQNPTHTPYNQEVMNVLDTFGGKIQE